MGRVWPSLPNHPKAPLTTKGTKVTRKDYILLAKTIRETMDDNAGNEEVQTEIILMVSRMASRLKQDNYRFDRDKFYQAALGR